jgi:hypothetical protein
VVDFLPGMAAARVHEEMLAHKARFGKKKLGSGAPAVFDLPRRFWLYLLQKEVSHGTRVLFPSGLHCLSASPVLVCHSVTIHVELPGVA